MHKKRTDARHVSRLRSAPPCVLEQRCTQPDPLMPKILSQPGQGHAFLQLCLVSGPGDRIAN
jgi:hypothetical protein